MKSLSKILLAVWLLGAVDANAELKKFVGKLPFPEDSEYAYNFEVSLQVKAGEVLLPKSLQKRNITYSPNINIDYGDVIVRPVHPWVFGYRSEMPTSYPVILGPAKIIFSYNSKHSLQTRPEFVFTYDLQKTTTSNSSPSLPSNTVVIPTDASGPVEIVMESSKDLVNWTRAEPGTYGTDTPKRFFRIRAVVKP
jgi:hypothetical protein